MANKVLHQEAKQFKMKRDVVLHQRAEVERSYMNSIPKQLMVSKVKRDFCNSRFLIMQRTSNTEARNKMVSEWTQEKMIVKAMMLVKKEREKLEEER